MGLFSLGYKAASYPGKKPSSSQSICLRGALKTESTLKTEEREHKQKVASLGCALCHHIYGDHEPGPVELHHLRTGGWGKGDYKTLIPLCFRHHRGEDGIHHLGTKGFEKYHHIRQQDLLTWTLDKIGEMT